MANRMLWEARLSHLLWPEAYAHANLLRNRLPLRGLGAATPYELYHGKRPRVDRLRVFGCDCHRLLPRYPKIPGSAKRERLIYIGETGGRVGWRCFNPRTYKISTEYELIFDEESHKRRWNALRHYDLQRHYQRMGRTDEAPVVFDDFDPNAPLQLQNNGDVIRRLFLGPPRRDDVSDGLAQEGVDDANRVIAEYGKVVRDGPPVVMDDKRITDELKHIGSKRTKRRTTEWNNPGQVSPNDTEQPAKYQAKEQEAQVAGSSGHITDTVVAQRVNDPNHSNRDSSDEAGLKSAPVPQRAKAEETVTNTEDDQSSELPTQLIQPGMGQGEEAPAEGTPASTISTTHQPRDLKRNEAELPEGLGLQRTDRQPRSKELQEQKVSIPPMQKDQGPEVDTMCIGIKSPSSPPHGDRRSNIRFGAQPPHQPHGKEHVQAAGSSG